MIKHTMWGKAIYSKNYKKLMNFVKTEKGKEFVSKLHTDSLNSLAKRYHCPFVLFFKNNTKNYRLIQKACDDNGITVVKTTVYPAIKPNIIDYTHITIPKNLTKEEMHAIEKKRPKKFLGKARFVHMEELDKMEDWEKEHPYPTEKECKENLFPEYLRSSWLDAYANKRTVVREQLTRMYYKERVKLIGRYRIDDNNYSEKVIDTVRINVIDANNIPNIPDNARIIKRAKNIAKTAVCCRIVNMSGTSGRIVLAA